jgi:hypothetical protein
MAGKDLILSSDDLFGAAIQGLEKSIKQPNILSFGEKKYPEQDRFFRSCAWGRFISGGNRGGKTDAIVIDAVWTATNKHPFRPRNPMRGARAPCSSASSCRRRDRRHPDPRPEAAALDPRERALRRILAARVGRPQLLLTFANGSTIDFVTHGMLLLKQGSRPAARDLLRRGAAERRLHRGDDAPHRLRRLLVHRRHADPRHHLDPRRALGARPAWRPGQRRRLPWPRCRGRRAYRHLHPVGRAEPVQPGADKKLGKFFIGMSKEVRAIRESGEMVAKSGLVFPNFKVETHTIEHIAPNKEWAWYSSVDFGINNPTAWLWHAVSPNGDIYTFAEHYAGGMTVPEHAAVVHAREFGSAAPPICAPETPTATSARAATA